MLGKLWSCLMAPRLQTVLKKLRHLVRQATGLRVMRMIVREFPQTDRPFQSLLEISKIESANYHR
jgi:hypothetical protein